MAKKFPTGLPFQRLGSFPLDDTCVMGTRAQLEDYIANDPRSYAGQIIYVIEEDDLFFLDANMGIRSLVADEFINEDELKSALDERLDGLTLVKLTKEEYAQLTEEDQNDTSKLYIIIDTEEIDFSLYATKEEVANMAPLSHTHATSEITGLDGILDNYDSTIESIQEDIEGKAAADHNHDDVYATSSHDHNDVYALLDHNHGTQYATASHTHEGVYAEKAHKHLTSDITDLSSYMNNRKFSQSQITDLETTLQGKSEVGHTHNISELDTWLDLDKYAQKSDLDKKVDKVDGKGLSTNDYTTEEKEKLAAIDLSAYASIEYVDEQISTHEHNLATEEELTTMINNLFQ